MADEILITKKDKWSNELKFRVTDKRHNSWMPTKYQNIVINKDYNTLAFLFYDLHCQGYPIDKAYEKFRGIIREPQLFFMKK
jgi:hypothetical protein